MVMKPGKMMTCLEGLLLIKSNEPLITCSCEITWQTKIIISPLWQCLWPPNVEVWWLTLRGSYPQSHMIIWWQVLWNHYISNTTIHMATKLDRMVTYLKGFLPMSDASWVTWSCEITWKIKNISPIPQCFWPGKDWGQVTN